MANNIYLTILIQILLEKMMKNHQKVNLAKTQFNLSYILMEFSMKIALSIKHGVIEYHDPHCKNCFSNDLIKKSFNNRKIYLENGISVTIKVKRYLCKKCRKYSQVRLNGIYED